MSWLAGTLKTNEQREERRSLFQSALDKSWGFPGFLSCLKASEATTTPELASTEAPYQGVGADFSLGGERTIETLVFGERRTFWSEEWRELGADFLSPFSLPQLSTPNFNPPRDKNPRQIPKFVLGDFSGCSTLVLCHKSLASSASLTTRALEPLNHTMAVIRTCEDDMDMAL